MTTIFKPLWDAILKISAKNAMGATGAAVFWTTGDEEDPLNYLICADDAETRLALGRILRTHAQALAPAIDYRALLKRYMDNEGVYFIPDSDWDGFWPGDTEELRALTEELLAEYEASRV